jgi:hypothetical protein
VSGQQLDASRRQISKPGPSGKPEVVRTRPVSPQHRSQSLGIQNVRAASQFMKGEQAKAKPIAM